IRDRNVTGVQTCALPISKTYEQGVGFLRIIDGDHPLDRTPIHPESYTQTEKLLNMIGLGLDDIGTEHLREELNKLDKKDVAEALDIGIKTIEDIKSALSRKYRYRHDEFTTTFLKTYVISLV